VAISIIDNEEFSESGNLTVPEGATLILAFVEGSVNPPKISGVDMASVSIVEALGVLPGIGVFQYQNPTIGSLPFSFNGTFVEVVYLRASGFRRGSRMGHLDGGDPLEISLPSADGDYIFGIARGSIGPMDLEGGGESMTLLKTSDVLKIGYVLAGAALVVCLAADTGSTEGYWMDGGQHWVDTVTVPGWTEYVQRWQPGFWYYEPHIIPGYWYTDPYGHREWIPEHTEWVLVWWPGNYWTEEIYHAPVVTPGHYEDNPDIWVEGAEVSAAFISVREYPETEFISRPIMFG
jgi:hypothetical protein